MEFYNDHLMKMEELRQYRADRKAANIIADILTVLIMVFVGLVIYCRIGG